MIRRIAWVAAFILPAPMALAETVEESIVRQLQEQGFTEIETERTWLGRVRVTATRDETERELVFNPQTGEILRDYWRDSNPTIMSSPSNSDGGAKSRPRDDDDDDDDDDDRDDD